MLIHAIVSYFSESVQSRINKEKGMWGRAQKKKGPELPGGWPGRAASPSKDV